MDNGHWQVGDTLECVRNGRVIERTKVLNLERYQQTFLTLKFDGNVWRAPQSEWELLGWRLVQEGER